MKFDQHQDQISFVSLLKIFALRAFQASLHHQTDISVAGFLLPKLGSPHFTACFAARRSFFDGDNRLKQSLQSLDSRASCDTLVIAANLRATSQSGPDKNWPRLFLLLSSGCCGGLATSKLPLSLFFYRFCSIFALNRQSIRRLVYSTVGALVVACSC